MSHKTSRTLAVQYGDQRIEFAVVPSLSRASSVRIQVDPLAGVQVAAPSHATDPEIRAAVRKRAKWLSKHLRLEKDTAVRKRVISGEEILYLGRRYLLKVEAGSGGTVKLKGGSLVVPARRYDPGEIAASVDRWYRERASEYFARRIDSLFSPSLDGAASPPKFRLRAMRRQWGSCSPSGNILLNPQLVRAPRTCVDYVIAHELCHLKHHDHSAGFYRLLKARIPDWQERKELLELIGPQIL